MLSEPVDHDSLLVLEAIRSTPSVASEVYERVNSLAGEDTVDEMAAAATTEVRSVVLGLLSDLATGDLLGTRELIAFRDRVGSASKVNWSLVGEAILLDVAFDS